MARQQKRQKGGGYHLRSTMIHEAENSEMQDILDTATNLEQQPLFRDASNGPVVLKKPRFNQENVQAAKSRGRGPSGSGKASRTARTLARRINGENRLGSPITESDDSSDDELGGEPPNALPASTLPSGLCYDPRMRFHCELDPPKDRSNFHPEDPRRIFHIYRAICEAGLVKDIMSPKELVEKPLYQIPARYAKKSELILVHEEAHIDFMGKTRGELL